VKPVAGAAKFVEHGANVVSSFIADKLSVDKIASLVELNNDEARIVKYEGDTYAMYKDQGGVLHAISSNCSHINCTIAWNRAEKTWDCPCHGSRFNINGKVLTGPAVRDLDRVKFAVPGQKATNEGKT
jgi:Rieske Fe-S protein